MEVGIRELKARLSEYVERAARGALVVVTDRGRPKAVLGPVPGRAGLDDGIAEGWVSPPRSDVRPARRRFQASRTISDLLAEDRGE
jgi:prevent-host-death family protein